MIIAYKYTIGFHIPDEIEEMRIFQETVYDPNNVEWSVNMDTQFAWFTYSRSGTTIPLKGDKENEI